MTANKKDYIEQFHDYGIYIPTRSILLEGEINSDSFNKILVNLHALDSSTGTINVFINSEGGDVDSGLAIYDAIRGCKNYVRAMVYGECSSAASFILQAADERLIAPNAYIMVHIGEAETKGHVINKKRWDKWQEKQDKKINNIYMEKIKQKKKKFTYKKLQDLMMFDTILTPKEAIELGLVDRIEEHFGV